MSIWSLRMPYAVLGVFLVGTLGCGHGADRLQAPKISSRSAAKAALSEYDSNGDGIVSGRELDKAPALKVATKNFDTDGDGGVSADEIATQIDV